MSKKIPEEEAEQIKALYKSGRTIHSLMVQFNRHHTTIERVIADRKALYIEQPLPNPELLLKPEKVKTVKVKQKVSALSEIKNDPECANCVYYQRLDLSSSQKCCHYLLMTGKARSTICPAGKGCTVQKELKVNESQIHAADVHKAAY